MSAEYFGYNSGLAAQNIGTGPTNIRMTFNMSGPNGPIKIAVLDTGVDTNHAALAGRLLPGWDFVDDDPDPSEVGDQ